MERDHCALVLGGYVNGYSIIQELHEKRVQNIILFDSSKKLASYSNKIKKFILIDETPESLLKEIRNLHEEYERVIVFPSDDLYLENLHAIYDKISPFCFLPFNQENLKECLDKYVQYSYCEALGVPYPKTMEIQKKEDIENIKKIQFPIIIKPKKREDMKTNVFRNLILTGLKEVEKNRKDLERHLDTGISFLASEIIPGDGSCIYAYVAYRNQDGKILNEWTGKKLSQYPNDFGVFSSASNEAPEEILEQGRILLNGMNIKGIAEPEFKYDQRDKKYKLIEINLRSMMWHRMGNLSGVNLQYSQYLDAIGKKVKPQTQIKDKNIHFVYIKHEISNLAKRKGYYRIFFRNLLQSDKTYLAVYDIKDIRPFLTDCWEIIHQFHT